MVNVMSVKVKYFDGGGGRYGSCYREAAVDDYVETVITYLDLDMCSCGDVCDCKAHEAYRLAEEGCAAVARLCQVLTDKGLLDANDIAKIVERPNELELVK